MRTVDQGMESLLFGMFTAIMLVDQVRWQLVQQLRLVLCDDGLRLQIMSILNDQTTIESMKKVGPRQAVMQPGYRLSVCCCNRSPYTPRRAVPTLCGSLGPLPHLVGHVRWQLGRCRTPDIYGAGGCRVLPTRPKLRGHVVVRDASLLV